MDMSGDFAGGEEGDGIGIEGELVEVGAEFAFPGAGGRFPGGIGEVEVLGGCVDGSVDSDDGGGGEGVGAEVVEVEEGDGEHIVGVIGGVGGDVEIGQAWDGARGRGCGGVGVGEGGGVTREELFEREGLEAGAVGFFGFVDPVGAEGRVWIGGGDFDAIGFDEVEGVIEDEIEATIDHAGLGGGAVESGLEDWGGLVAVGDVEDGELGLGVVSPGVGAEGSELSGASEPVGAIGVVDGGDDSDGVAVEIDALGVALDGGAGEDVCLLGGPGVEDDEFVVLEDVEVGAVGFDEVGLIDALDLGIGVGVVVGFGSGGGIGEFDGGVGILEEKVAAAAPPPVIDGLSEAVFPLLDGVVDEPGLKVIGVIELRKGLDSLFDESGIGGGFLDVVFAGDEVDFVVAGAAEEGIFAVAAEEGIGA